MPTGKEKRAQLIAMMIKGKAPDEGEPAPAEDEPAPPEASGPSEEHAGIANDLHDAVHGHDKAALAEVIHAIISLAKAHSEPDGDEAPPTEE